MAVRSSVAAFAILILAASLFAFGGGGGGSGGSSRPAEYVSQQVKVSDSEGSPIAGVLVLALESGSNSVAASAKTDSSGTASMTLEKNRTMTVRAVKDGYEQASKSATVGQGAVEISIRQLAPSRPRAANATNASNASSTAERQFALNGRMLPCGDGATMRERVECRLSVRTDDYERLYYVPEECRAASNESGAQSCLQLYDSVQSCRRLEGQESRFACVRRKLGINGTASQAISACRASANPAACRAGLSEKVFSLAKFRLYNLEEQAEYLGSEGLARETVVDFIARLEQRKLDFNAAGSIAEKQSVLREALSDWREFKAQAIAELQAKEGNG